MSTRQFKQQQHINSTTTANSRNQLRTQYEKELKKKQLLLNDSNLVNNLPDKGKRVQEQILHLQQQLKQLDLIDEQHLNTMAQISPATTKSPLSSSSSTRTNGDTDDHHGSIDSLNSLFTKKATISSPEEQKQMKTKRRNANNFLLRNTMNQEAIPSNKSVKQLEEELLFIQGKRGAALFNKTRVEVLSLEEVAQLEQKRREREIAELLSSQASVSDQPTQLRQSLMHRDDDVDDVGREDHEDDEEEGEVVDYDDVDD